MDAYKHQKKIIDEDPKTAGLFLGTGAGKSYLALSLAEGKTLVICTKTLREDKTWERQLSKMDKTLSITVMSKEEFRRDAHKLPRFNTVIIDEAHTCLGATPSVRWIRKKPIPKTSQLFEELDKYIQRTKPERLYLVTATVLKSPMTVWAAAKLLGESWNFYEFRDAFYFRLPMPGREVWITKNDVETKNRIATAVKNLGYTGRLEDFFDVPPQTHKVDHIELTAKQKARIKDMQIEYPEAIVRVGKIHQIENGVLAGDEFNRAEEFENGKIDKILDYAVEFPKMVIFAKYRTQIERIAEALKKEGKKVFILTGDTKDRGALIKEANDTNEGIFIAQAQISAGWELPSYPVMIFASQTYSFVDYDQAIGRIQRSNNIKKNLYITLVVKGGTDEAVYECVENKKDFNERIYTENN